MKKAYIEPMFRGEDRGDGGIRRVVEAQIKHLPQFGWDIADKPEQADLIAIHAGNWAGGKLDVPKVAHCHGLYWNEYVWPAWAIDLNKHVTHNLIRADAITAPSRWVASILERYFWRDVHVLEHGIDVDEWAYSAKQDGPVIWNKTRIDPVCDPAVLDQLAALAHDVPFKTTFGSERSNVTVIGPQAYQYAKSSLEGASIYLATSRETFGIGTLEAMACGMPVLGWAWGGQRDIITHKVDGYLAKPNAYDDLLSGLYFILANWDGLSANARMAAMQYTWPTRIQRYATLYDDVVGEHPAPVKVSIVIPCYNLGRYLSQCVGSILSQSYSDYEIIIVDDASTDDSGDYADKMAGMSTKIHVIHNKTNQYLAGALNTGMATAKGKYILPLDADNMLGDEALGTLVNVLDNEPELDIVYGRVKFVLEDGVTPDKGVSGDGISKWPPDGFSYRYQMSHKNQIPSTALYRRQVWERTLGYRTRCRTAEDADFWCRASSFGFNPAKVTDAVHLIYRQREGSMSRVEKDWGWEQWYPKDPPASPGNHANISTCEPCIISVIIPVGPDHTGLVLDALDSLWAQTFQKFEAIVIDDSGPGNDFPIPSWVKYASTLQAGSGPAAARNYGITIAQGRLLFFLDADDYLQPQALELMYNSWLENRGYIYSDWYVAENGELHGTNEWDPHALLKKMPHSVSILCDATLGLRFDESLMWEDWDFLIQLGEIGSCGHRVPVPLLNYRVTKGRRREETYANQEEAKAQILAKWDKYIRNPEEYMACRTCGGAPRQPSQAQAQAQYATLPVDSVTLLEFVGHDTRSYRGQQTGTLYRFGSDRDHRVKYVDNRDVAHLLSLGAFRVYAAVEPQLVAAK